MTQFADQGSGGSPAGTPVDAAHFNALVVAAGHIQAGTIPTSYSGTSLTITVPALTAIVPTGTEAALSVAMAATTLTVAASMDTYVDLAAGGAYTQTVVATGTTPPAVAATSTRLYKVMANATGVTAIVGGTPPFATAAPVSGAMVQTGTANGVAGLDSGARLPVGQLPTNITVGGKLTLPTTNYSNVAGGGGVVAVGAALSGNVPVNNGIANGTTWQINTTAATAGSTVVVTPACGAITNMAFVVQSNPGGGSFNVMLNTTNGAALNAAGAFYWAIVSSL